MNGPLSFGAGIFAAALLALAGSAGFTVFHDAFGTAATLDTVITLVAGGYLAFIAYRSGLKRGRLVLPAGWLCAAAGIAVFSNDILTTAAAHTLLITLVRALCCHRSVLSMLTDGALGAAALIAAIATARHTQSVALSLWCYFLLQALFVLIPVTWGRPAETCASDAISRFGNAHAQAEAALRRLHKTSL